LKQSIHLQIGGAIPDTLHDKSATRATSRAPDREDEVAIRHVDPRRAKAGLHDGQALLLSNLDRHLMDHVEKKAIPGRSCRAGAISVAA
jgi:hypothetical protein